MLNVPFHSGDGLICVGGAERILTPIYFQGVRDLVNKRLIGLGARIQPPSYSGDN